MKKLKKFVVLCLAVIMLFTACGKKGEEVTKELSITQMQTICELATLKCYYHNVAKLTKEKEVLWWDTSAELDRVFRHRKARCGHCESGYAGRWRSGNDHDAKGRGA